MSIATHFWRPLAVACLVALHACGGGGGASGAVSGPAPGPVTPPAPANPLLSISLVSAQSDAVAPGESTHYEAYGHYANQLDVNITADVSWASSDSAVAAVHGTAGTYGDVEGIAPGTASITATLDKITRSVTLTVLPIKLLEGGLSDSPPGGVTAAAIDAQGRSNVSVAHSFSGSLFGTTPIVNVWSHDRANDSWTPTVRANAAVADGSPTFPVMAANAGGVATLVWTGRLGVFAARYSPSAGWQPARAIVTGTTNSLTFATSLRVATDPAGNAIALWADSASNTIFSSQFLVSADAWSIPVAVPGGARGLAQTPCAFAMNPAGKAVMVCEGSSLSPAWTVSATLYDPVTGWGTPTAVHTASSYTNPDVAINGAGEVLVAGAGSFDANVYASRYVPGTGWQAEQALAGGNGEQPRSPKVGINDSGDAIVVWGDASDDSVFARRFTRAGGWEPRVSMTAARFGTPEVLPPFVAGDGRMFATWVSGSVNVGFGRYLPGSGWQAEGRFAQMGHKGFVYDVVFAANALGNLVATWAEGVDRYDDQGISHRTYYYFADSTLGY